MANVLVVDDSTIMRRNISTILSNAGHTVVAEAANGELGVRKYKEYNPDLVTMDITMPVMDGINAVKQIMMHDPEAQVIIISSLDQKFMVLTALQNGAKHYIIKPFSPDKVLKVVNDVLSTSTKAPSEKQHNSLGSINSTIADIGISIDNIKASIKKLDEK